MKSLETKLVEFHQTGGADVLQIVKKRVDPPKAGEVRIAVKAIGLNRAEVLFREGQYLESPVFPSKLGYEASGYVEAVGPGVKGIAIGDRVSTIPAFSMGTYGVYGVYAVVPEHAVVKYPEKLTMEEGTSIWMSYLTAYGALVHFGKISKNHGVLITAASSSVGISLIQMAKAEGGVVIATTRKRDKMEFLYKAGADHVIDTQGGDLETKVLEYTGGKGVDLILDPIGGPLLETLGSVCSQNGTIIEYGALDTGKSIYPLFPALAKGLNIKGYTLFEITKNSALLERAVGYVKERLTDGTFHPLVDKIFPFERIAEAHEYMESNNQVGKIVVSV